MDNAEIKDCCAVCAGPIVGVKCEICGCEADSKELATHVCGDVHCLPKCDACCLPESKCPCPPTSTTQETPAPVA